MIQHTKRLAVFAPAVALLVAFALSGCATRYSTEPQTSTTTANTVTIDEFYSPPPNGSADDYYVLNDGEDDVEYSYFLDEQDYFNALDNGNSKYYIFIRDYAKKGHGYGDHNHLHEFVKGPHHYHCVYIGKRRVDWTDSLALTDSEKVRIDTAMLHFKSCAQASIDSFRVALKPYRAEFRTSRLAILAELDSNKVTRDSARALLDSAIVKYQTETALLRASFATDLAVCRTELDVEVQAILTPTQYAIWVRHRGW